MLFPIRLRARTHGTPHRAPTLPLSSTLKLLPESLFRFYKSIYVMVIPIYAEVNFRTARQITPEINSGEACHSEDVLQLSHIVFGNLAFGCGVSVDGLSALDFNYRTAVMGKTIQARSKPIELCAFKAHGADLMPVTSS